ncbi:VWA domain-containing protein [Schinkia sp. CFF1]
MKGYKYIIQVILIVVLVFMFAGCSGKSSGTGSGEQIAQKGETRENVGITEEAKQKKEILAQLEAPAVPGTMEGILNYPPGLFAGQDFMVEGNIKKEKMLDQLPELIGFEDDPEVKEALYAKLVSLFAWEYFDLYDIVQGWDQDKIAMPEFDDPRYALKENFNVEIILDASGSMKAKIGGKTKLEIAKASINQFTSSLPEGANISLRVYGHVGGGEMKSCNKIEQIYGMKPYSANEFNTALNKVSAVGWTPLAKALDEAKKDMAHLDSETNTNFIYFVSDGIETCGGDPVRAAKEIAESNIQPVVHIIGFDVASDEQKQLIDMAEAANGIYASARNQQELIAELNKVKELAKKWENWRNQTLRKIDSTEIDKGLELLEAVNDMNAFALEENLSLLKAADYLYFQDKISLKTNEFLIGKANVRYKFIKDNISSFEKQAKELKNNDYEESKKLIEEMYSQNINDLKN